MAALCIERARPGWRFWVLWMLATSAGAVVPLSVLVPVANAISEFLNPTGSEVWVSIAIGMFASVTVGGAIGAAQWLVLRGYLPRTGWWVLATLIGYLMPLALGGYGGALVPSWLMGATMFLESGVLLGVLQWLVLRGRVDHAAWWIPISIAGWVIAPALTDIAYTSGLYVEPFDILAMFIVPLAVAGGGMVWLLRRTAPTIASNDLAG